jgi:hypothetical protein
MLKSMLSVKTLREHLLPISPQAAIDHWARIFEKYGDSPDFENPRVAITTKSGSTFNGYLVSAGSQPNSKDRHLILILVLKHDTDQARDILYLNFSDVESIAFYDIDHILQYLARK